MDMTEMQAKIEALEKATSMATTINAEVFYWWCTALMIAIHAGFLAYEMGASRAKNALASGIKNLLAVAINGVAIFYLVFTDLILWPHALGMAAGAIAGGVAGAGTARRLGRPVVRRIVIAVGFAMALTTFVRL